MKILILGATSAIATEVARLYARAGHELFLIARNAERLQSLVDELGTAVRGHLAADLDEVTASPAHVHTAIDGLDGLDTALIAHGLLGDQIESEHNWQHAHEILTTNLASAISLAMPIANYFEKQNRGHLGVITSVAGERGRPRNYTYGAAKGGLTKYLQGMRSRFYGTDVWIHNIKLGPVDTPMSAGHDKHALFGEKCAVARGIVKALAGRKHVNYLPKVWALVMFIVRAVPEPIFQRFNFLAGR